MVVVSHLSLFLEDKFRGRCDSCESHLPLIKTIYFPIAPCNMPLGGKIDRLLKKAGIRLLTEK